MRRYRLYRKIRHQSAMIRDLVTSVTRPIKRFNDTHDAGLVKVTLWFIDHDPESTEQFSPTEHIVARHDLAVFLEATLQLHFEPGINPHNRQSASPVQYITTQFLRPRGPYWWSVSGLGRNADPAGALIWAWESPKRVWIRPGVDIDTEGDQQLETAH